MAKPQTRPYSRYTQDATGLMGDLIRKARLERRQTLDDLAERAGISRGLLQRIERGDPGCAIGAVFEVAALSSIPLFGLDRDQLRNTVRQMEETLTLLPKTARGVARKSVKDDF